MSNNKWQTENIRHQISRVNVFFVICHLIFDIYFLTACQTLGDLVPRASPTSTPTLAPEAQGTSLAVGDPPGPVLDITPLPDGGFLVGVGPIGDADTGFEWRLYRGRDGAWRPLAWPPEAIPRSLHSTPAGDLLFVVPFSNALFGRGQAWGLMRSANGGGSWQQALAGLGDPYVMDLALSPAFGDDRTLFAVTWYNGVYRSSDAGQTWEALPLAGEEMQPSGGANPYDLAVAVSPDYSDSDGTGLVMASFSHRLRRQEASADTWRSTPLTVTATVKDFEPPAAQLSAGRIAFSPNFADDGTIYLYSGYAGLFRSADRGMTWERIGRRLPLRPPFVADFHLAVASAAEAYVLLATGETDPALGQPARTLYRTSDGGISWEELYDPPTLGWVSAFALGHDAQGQVVLHLGGSRGGVTSHLAGSLPWD
jgi:hypothetical protein